MFALMPHGSCFFWQLPLTSLHVFSNLLISFAYLSIPILLYVHRQHVTVTMRPLLFLFAAFILSCGVGHLIEAWNIWHANYWLEGAEKLVTGLISGYTVLQLQSRIPRLLSTQKILEETEELARLDPLTGLLNRRALNEAIAIGIDSRNRYQAAQTFMLIDLDNFKEINDTYGHPVGDAILKEIARVMHENTRSIDSVARLGGDEFAVLLSGCSIAEAAHVAHKLNQAVAQLSLSAAGHTISNIAISIGIADMGSDTTVETLYQRADAALYTAKRLGKNQTYVHNPV
jgi:diguanylate cyclase (GGDEF)-like protein